MSASEHLHPYQMKLFMQAKELMDIPAADAGFLPMSLSHGLVKHKLSESQGKLYESIKKIGVQKPVSVMNTSWADEILANGHHRVASANDINPEMYIPIEYKDSPDWL